MSKLNIRVKLIGTDGNSFALLGRCIEAMEQANIPQSEQDEFMREATSGDYNNLLATCMKWFDVE